MSAIWRARWRRALLPFAMCGRVVSEIVVVHFSVLRGRMAACVVGLPQVQQSAVVFDFTARWYTKTLEERAQAEARHSDDGGPRTLLAASLGRRCLTWCPDSGVDKLS